MAEAEDLKSSQCGFDPHSGHHLCVNDFIYLPRKQISINNSYTNAYTINT